MKRSVLVACMLGLVVPGVMALDGYPITTIAEVATSTT